MDKHLKKVLLFSTSVLLLFILVIYGFVNFYRYSTLNAYNAVLLFLIFMTILITVLFITTGAVFFHTYQKKRVSKTFRWALALGLKITLPFLMLLSGRFKNSRNTFRRLYVEVNNLYVEAAGKKYSPRDILILLPHCLQNAECSRKVTHDINLCNACGKCNIGEILCIARKKGIKARVVTGGTVARNIVSRDKPRLILSVACERDLTSGMADVGKIPVLGIVNDRPNGPCYNTFVNMEELERRVNDFCEDGRVTENDSGYTKGNSTENTIRGQ